MREKSRHSKAKWLAMALVLTAAIGAGATATWSGVGARVAEKYPGPSECNAEYNERTIGGCFGWHSTAFIDYTTDKATAAIGLMHLDGAGNLKGWYSGSFVGNPVVRNYTGTYTVNPNGTGRMKFDDVFPDTGHYEFDFVIVNRGNEVLMTSTLGHGIVQNVEMKRQ